MAGGRTLGVGMGMAIVLAVIACGSTAPSPSPAQVCARMYDVFVARSQRCGGDPVPVGRADYLELCEQMFQWPGMEGTEDGHDQCATEIERASCAYEPRCWPHGSLGGGAPCGTHQQCISGYCSRGSVPNDFICGVCLPGLALGESCADAKPGCGSGLWCDGTKHCAKSIVRMEGESCDRSAGTFCRYGTQCANGVCRLPAGLGEACTGIGCVAAYACTNGVCAEVPGEGQPCTSNLCALHHYCSPQSKTCVAMKVAGHGEPCGPIDTECVAGHYCNGGICTGSGPVPRGGACSTTNDCTSPFGCIGGTCQLLDPRTCK